ncbi:MAG: FecR family protein, partial [Defluviitaleaceae bacterium]|nr:FecR family protein [Defluviitaleaceae bacterium]
MIRRIIAVVVAVVMMVSLFPVQAAAQGADEHPRVEAARGSVFIHRAGGHQLTAVHRGMNIYDGDMIITGINSTATVSYYRQMLTMGELTKLSVNSVWQRHGRHNSAITLVEGMVKVRVDVQLDDNSRNVVQAAGTIVGVRGTEYILVYRRTGLTNDDIHRANPFVRMMVVEGEVIVDLPDADAGEDGFASFLVTPLGVMRLQGDMNNEVTEEAGDIPDTLVVPLESLDLSILEMLRDDPRARAQNPELFSRIEEA